MSSELERAYVLISKLEFELEKLTLENVSLTNEVDSLRKKNDELNQIEMLV